MREMQQRQQEANQPGQQAGNSSAQPDFHHEKQVPEKEGDYIEFEEIK